MPKYYSIASGSKGNCGLFITEKFNILIDMGVSYKYLCTALEKHDMSISDIDIILITHEHGDHIKGLPMICKNTNIPIYITEKSHINAKEFEKITNTVYFKPYEEILFEDIFIKTFALPHDSAECVGFKIIADKIAFSYATDCGYMPNSVLNEIKYSDFVVLESNYDIDMLEMSSYPASTKNRILSNNGHLSNIDCSQCVITLLESGVSQIIFSHLSENNNTKKNVELQIKNLLKYYKIDAEFGKNLHIAPVKNDYKIINIESRGLCKI